MVFTWEQLREFAGPSFDLVFSMPACAERDALWITGVGVVTAIGQGKDAFIAGLLSGLSAFGVLRREGRQGTATFLGAELQDLKTSRWEPHNLRRVTLTAQAALVALAEAWDDARLEEVEPRRVGLIMGGSNVQQRETWLTQEAYRSKPNFLPPRYGLTFLDSDIVGICTEEFGIKGPSFTIGGSSASGQLAVIQAAQAVRNGMVDICIAIGALMDISYWECQAFRSLGAMGGDGYEAMPDLACRPFDQDRSGFIYGEACGAVVIERAGDHQRARAIPYARLLGSSVVMDASRSPRPTLESEIAVITNALKRSNLAASDIDYINPHGSGSVIGDEVELEALRSCRLTHAHINATKSIIGHGLSAAGLVEIIASVLQMRAGQLHPTRNLDKPITSQFNWVRERPTAHKIGNAVNLSVGFGGMNTAVCLAAP